MPMLAMITDKDAWPFFALVGAMLLVAVPLLIMVIWHRIEDRGMQRALDSLHVAIECDAMTTTLRDCRPRPLPTARTVRA